MDWKGNIPMLEELIAKIEKPRNGYMCRDMRTLKVTTKHITWP